MNGQFKRALHKVFHMSHLFSILFIFIYSFISFLVWYYYFSSVLGSQIYTCIESIIFSKGIGQYIKILMTYKDRRFVTFYNWKRNKICGENFMIEVEILKDELMWITKVISNNSRCSSSKSTSTSFSNFPKIPRSSLYTWMEKLG